MDQSVPQIAGQLRKDRGQLRRASLTRLRHDLLEADGFYLWIGSKPFPLAQLSGYQVFQFPNVCRQSALHRGRDFQRFGVPGRNCHGFFP